MKKMFSLALALIMALALCVPAFAEETTNVDKAEDKTGMITVANEDEITNAEYKAYKIFDVTYSGDNYAYTIRTDSKWYNVVADYASNKDKHGIWLVASAGDVKTMVVYTNETFSAPLFASYLSANRPLDAVGEEFNDAGVAVNLDLGYWFVTSNQGSLCNLTTTDPTATIYDKNWIPFEKTDNGAEDVEVGQIVNYTITGVVPETDGFKSYLYEIADTMSEGLTFNKDVVMKLTLPEAYGNVAINFVADESWCKYSDDGFVLTMNLMTFFNNGSAIPVGTDITVTYTATVNEKAVSVVSKNSATLKYSNDPNNDTYTVTIPEEETVYSAKIVIDKYDGTDIDKTASDEEQKAAIAEAKRLSGAEFVLKNAENKFYKYDDDAKKVSWVEAQEDATVAITKEGVTEFIGLKNGTYNLIETVAPTGYNLLTAPVEIVIDGNGDADYTELSIEAEIANNTGTELPSTGGIGTTIFYTVGGVLMAAAVVLFVTKKKLSVQE